MGNSNSNKSEIYDYDETEEFQQIGELPVIIPEITKYVPSEMAIFEYEQNQQIINEIENTRNVQSINDNIEQVADGQEFDEIQNSQNTVVTIDLMDFNVKFPCPICSFEGQNKQLSIITLSDHMSMHKYEIALNKKIKNTQKINNYNGGISEDEAIRIAMLESDVENKPKINKLVQAPVIIKKGKKLKRQETEYIDLNEVNCD